MAARGSSSSPPIPGLAGFRRFSQQRTILAVVVFGVLLFFLWRPKDASAVHEATLLQDIQIHSDAHVIERMHLEAKLKDHQRYTRQSATFPDAKAAYKQRYHRDPPWAFGTWYQLARAWDSQLIDDGFDQIAEQLEPYRDYFAHDCDQAEYSPSFLNQWRLIQMCFEDRQVSVAGFMEKWYVEALKFLVTEFKDWAPNVCVLINVGDEPRVLLPHELPAEAKVPKGDIKGKYQCPKLKFTDKRHQNVWPDVQQSCRPTPEPDNQDARDTWSNVDSMRDMCRLGASFHHGTLEAPDNMMIQQQPVPILSAAKLSPFADILLPSPWRLTERPQWHDFEDLDWTQKRAMLYWRGSTTGGYGHDSSWHFHRQNLVQHINDYHHLSVDVMFSNATQCNERACEEQQSQLPFGSRESLAEAWKHMLVLDMDGNGASGRLYDLLRSASAVLRHSFMKEWHDDRLVPWLHYAPLSADLEQVDETIRFLLSQDGEKVAHGIAEAGAKAVNETLRFQDVKLYFYRLVLEMGRDKKPPVYT